MTKKEHNMTKLTSSPLAVVNFLFYTEITVHASCLVPQLSAQN